MGGGFLGVFRSRFFLVVREGYYFFEDTLGKREEGREEGRVQGDVPGHNILPRRNDIMVMTRRPGPKKGGIPERKENEQQEGK